MKKFKIFGLIWMLVFIFAGCTGKTNKSELNSNKTIKTNLMCNSYENGLIYYNDKALYLDYDTMKSTVFCAVPNCTHTTSTCIGKIVGECPIIYNDYIYYFTSIHDAKETNNGREFYIDSKLCRVSLDSSQIDVVSEFTDSVPMERDTTIVNNNVLYFIATDMNVQKDEYGQIFSSNVGGEQYICSINLETGEYINYGNLYEGDRQYEWASHSRSAAITGCFNGKIYINYCYLKEEIPSDAIKEGFDARDYFTLLCFEFDLETKKFTESELPYSAYVDIDTYIYYDFEKEKSIMIQGEKTYEFDCDVEQHASVYNNKMFNLYEQTWYDLSDFSEHSMGEYGKYSVVDYYDSCYILVYGTRYVKLTEDELFALK